MRIQSVLILLSALILVVVSTSQVTAADNSDIRGAWHPVLYQLKDETKHRVTGLIMFTEKDWSVLFFIMKDGEPQRGSGEGGTYTLNGNKLVFRHLYNFSGGLAAQSTPASEPTMKARPTDTIDAPSESCTIELRGEVLTIHFPSGNLMVFRRSSGF